jgi:Acetyltransferase (GNAT) domain
MAAAHGSREDADLAPHVEYDHTLAVFDDDQTVGTADAFSLELTLPGLATVPAAGLSFVTVLPTHRRHGTLGALMQRHFNDAEAAASRSACGTPPRRASTAASATAPPATTSSTSRIPGGPPSTHQDKTAAACGRSRRRGAAAATRGARPTPPPPARRHRQVPSAVGADRARPKWLCEADGPRFFAMHQAEPGSLDGYVIWRVEPRWTGGFPDNLVGAVAPAVSEPGVGRLWP